MCRKRISEDLRANQLRDASAELRAWALKSQSQSRRAPLSQLVVDVDVVVAFAAAGEAAKRAAGADVEGSHLCRSVGVAPVQSAERAARSVCVAAAHWHSFACNNYYRLMNGTTTTTSTFATRVKAAAKHNCV